MSIHIKSLSDPNIVALLERIDRLGVSDKDGHVEGFEAAEAARRIGRRGDWRAAAEDAFGVAPRSGAELMRFVARPPKDAALDRILGHSFIAGFAEHVASGQGDRMRLGEVGRGRHAKALAITPGGRISRGGKLPQSLDELSTALYDAAKVADISELDDVNETTQRRLFRTLSDALEVSQSGRRSKVRERLFCGAMAMLQDLVHALEPGSQGELRAAVTDRALQALAHEKDPELKMFYLMRMKELEPSMDSVQQAAFHAIEKTALPKAPPVEEYTAGRTEPLVVAHTIHEEFWHEELEFYNEPGWKLVSKNRKDTTRVYEGLQKDPTGKKPPLKVKVTVQKGELDFFEKMGDPKTHVVIYSGHSSLGGNGSQAVADAPDAAGEHPKTVLVSSCRGQDNYAEFANKFPEAMLITTRDPTYSDSGQLRIRGLYDTLIRGESFAHMRNTTRSRFWEEKADNYIYPDEMRRFRYMDLDEDGQLDLAPTGQDRLFDVQRRHNLGDFTRAISFVNTELFYHWELEHEMGNRSTFGREYFDHVIADGSIPDPKPGELVRVTTVEQPGAGGRMEKFFQVQCDPRDIGDNRDLYAGKVTAHVMMELSREKFGEVTPFEAMRGVLAGAQAIHYLDVYENTAPQNMREYLDAMGLPEVKNADIEKVFHEHDSHITDAQVQAFVELLESKRGIDLNNWSLPGD